MPSGKRDTNKIAAKQVAKATKTALPKGVDLLRKRGIEAPATRGKGPETVECSIFDVDLQGGGRPLSLTKLGS